MDRQTNKQTDILRGRIENGTGKKYIILVKI